MKSVQIKSGRAALPMKIFIIPQTFGYRGVLELICVFLRGAAWCYRMGNSPQLGTFWGAAAYSQFIRAGNKNHEARGERESERGSRARPWTGRAEMGPNVIRRTNRSVKSNTPGRTPSVCGLSTRPIPPPPPPLLLHQTPGCYLQGLE